MKTTPNLLFCFFLLINFSMRGQELNAIILDSLKQNPIPFASIYLKSGSGVVSNEEGRFRLQVDASETTDSLFISCMGYETLGLSLPQAKDSIFYLTPKAIELNSVILSNKQLDVKQILKEIQKDIPQKYELGFSKKKVFFRETGSQRFKSLGVKIKKTSIPEFNQGFWDATLSKVPRYNEWYFELLGNLNGDYTKESQKLELLMQTAVAHGQIEMVTVCRTKMTIVLMRLVLQQTADAQTNPQALLTLSTVMKTEFFSSLVVVNLIMWIKLQSIS
jgi:hypothetical protein